MTIKRLGICALAMLLASVLAAQDLAGRWQGTLPQGRIVVKIERAAHGRWNGRLYSPDQYQDWGVFLATGSIALQGAHVIFAVDDIHGKYEGKLSADGTSIEGTWRQGDPQSLELKRTTAGTEWKDPSPHKVQFVTVGKDVKLEVLDWGGSGRPLVFLAGGGNTAHVWDDFVPALTGKYHVYGITRRGFGDSSAPASGYSADRLGDDVIAVLDALKLSRPVLVGHSIAGEELSSVGSRHPERIAGLIYLDAVWTYAFYDSSIGDFYIDLRELKKKLEQLEIGKEPQNEMALVRELLERDLPGFERDLKEQQKDLEAWATETPPHFPVSPVIQKMFAGFQKYTSIPVPILAICAVPHSLRMLSSDDAVRAALEARDKARMEAILDAFAKDEPTARIVRLPHADHYVFRSNGGDVLREMNAFLDSLK